MNRFTRLIEELKEEKPETIFLTGSMIGGWMHEDSDIDIVSVVQDIDHDYEQTYAPNYSVHRVHPESFEHFERVAPFCHLRTLALFGEAARFCYDTQIKRELVRRQLVRFDEHARKQGIENYTFTPIDPVNNYLFGYAARRPWRVPHTKKMTGAPRPQRLLAKAYTPVLDLMAAEGIIDKKGDNYCLNGFGFWKEWTVEKGNPWMLFKKNLGGLKYVTELPGILDFLSKRI